MDFCKNELYNKELRFEEPNRCLSLVRKNRPTFWTVLLQSGGMDETRTRDLLRDRQAF